jgi:hypothetical protein
MKVCQRDTQPRTWAGCYKNTTKEEDDSLRDEEWTARCSCLWRVSYDDGDYIDGGSSKTNEHAITSFEPLAQSFAVGVQQNSNGIAGVSAHRQSRDTIHIR